MRYLFAHFLQTIDVLDTGKRCRPYCANLSFPSAFFLWKVNNFRWLLHPEAVFIDPLRAGIGLDCLVLMCLLLAQPFHLVVWREVFLQICARYGYYVADY